MRTPSHALKDAREIGQAATLMLALWTSWCIDMHLRKLRGSKCDADELLALADEKGASFWKAVGMTMQGCALALAGKASEAVQIDHVRTRREPVNGSDGEYSLVSGMFGDSIC